VSYVPGVAVKYEHGRPLRPAGNEQAVDNASVIAGNKYLFLTGSIGREHKLLIKFVRVIDDRSLEQEEEQQHTAIKDEQSCQYFYHSCPLIRK
jgi:hypothetical protein